MDEQALRQMSVEILTEIKEWRRAKHNQWVGQVGSVKASQPAQR